MQILFIRKHMSYASNSTFYNQFNYGLFDGNIVIIGYVHLTVDCSKPSSHQLLITNLTHFDQLSEHMNKSQIITHTSFVRSVITYHISEKSYHSESPLCNNITLYLYCGF